MLVAMLSSGAHTFHLSLNTPIQLVKAAQGVVAVPFPRYHHPDILLCTPPEQFR